MAIVETDLTEAEVTELLVDVEELRRTTTNNLRAIREFRNDIREIKSLIFQVFGRQETPSTPNPPSSGVSSLHKPPIDTDRPIPNIAATHPPLLDNLATHLVIPVHQPPTKASKEVDDVPDMTDAELFSTGLVEVDSKPILKRVDAMPMSEVKVPINSIHICCISEPHESPQGSLEFRYDQIILILIKFVNTYFVRNKIFVDTGWNPVERGGMVAAGSSKAAESQNRSDMLADEKRLKLENKAVMLGARDVARDIMCSSFPILKKFCGTLNSNMGRSLICVRSDFKDEQIKIQRNINELMVDNLMEEDEIRELDDLDLEFNEISEDDEELDEYDMLTKVIDTYASLTRKGKDIQGIPWDRLNVMRDEYRTTRIDHYKNFENFPLAGEAVKEQCKRVSKDGNYFEFFHNSRMVKPILHFQLRNLIWATSKHDVYLMSNYSLMHWSSISSRLTEILNFSENVTPNEKHLGNIPEGFNRTQISTLAVLDKIMVLGGFQGELICKKLNKQGVSFCSRTSYEDNAISNAIEIYDTFSGLRFMASSNDGGIREYDMERFQMLNHFRFPWAVNHTSVSSDSKLSVVVGDDLDGLLIDSRSGKTISPVSGHADYSFASAWHPNGLNFATGNQDKTTRVWDIRNLSSSVAILKGNIGAIRSLRFSTDGHFMVAAEAADFVHVYNTKTNYEEEQEIDFFGEISGVSLSPDDESIYIGIWDRTYASMLQYNRRHTYQYLDDYY